MKKIVFCLFSIFIFQIIFAQTSQSEIVLSEERIQILANKLYTLKLARNQAQKPNTKNYNKNQYTSILNTIKVSDTLTYSELQKTIDKLLIYEDVYGKDSIFTRENLNSKSRERLVENEKISNSILERLVEIEKDLKAIKAIQNEPIIIEQAQGNNKETRIIQSTSSKKDKQTQNSLAATNTKLDSILQLLNNPITDSIINAKKQLQPIDSSKNNKEIESLKNQIYLLHAKLDRVLDDQIEDEAKQKVQNMMRDTDTLVVEKTNEIDPLNEAFLARKEKYGAYFEQIYFANNSIELENKYDRIIESLVIQLNEEPKIDVSIAGFASKTGNEAYNQQLSMQRALILKKELIKKGISPQRILTDYKGIDYNAESLEDARRLDIEFVVRR